MSRACPVCHGKGELAEPRRHLKDQRSERRKMARVLRKAGYSLRQIGGLLGYKSPRSVVLAVTRDD
jgi:hypothetical protein